MSVYVKTVEELIEYLKTLPQDLIVCDGDSDLDGVNVTYCQGDNFLVIQGD